MKVELQEYNREWPEIFFKERELLMNKIGRFLVGSIEHVGSTAVPGMLAKPIIDIMFGVKNLEASKEAIGIMQSNGYCYYPYKAEVMHWFCKPSPEFRTHHLHLIPFESPLWCERIRFRDVLRSDGEIAKEYMALKTRLATNTPDDRERYTSEKWPFIKRVLQNIN